MIQLVKKLLGQGASATGPGRSELTHKQITPLVCALQLPDSEIVAVLIAQGASSHPNSTYEGGGSNVLELRCGRELTDGTTGKAAMINCERWLWVILQRRDDARLVDLDAILANTTPPAIPQNELLFLVCKRGMHCLVHARAYAAPCHSCSNTGDERSLRQSATPTPIGLARCPRTARGQRAHTPVSVSISCASGSARRSLRSNYSTSRLERSSRAPSLFSMASPTRSARSRGFSACAAR